MKNLSLSEFCELVSQPGSAPGGGSMAFLNLALGCSLILKSLPKDSPQEIISNIRSSMNTFLSLVEKDAQIFNEYLKSRKDSSVMVKSCMVLKEGLETLIKMNLKDIKQLEGHVKQDIKVDYKYGMDILKCAADGIRRTLTSNLNGISSSAEKDRFAQFINEADNYFKTL
ncbi:MAG: cyclodeaminase/cyclohydrolase family protein [Planctomycetes bacterium]|nr:cyclodeaminase/cyclohydrolase family protein [Planctomycetota bacterium]